MVYVPSGIIDLRTLASGGSAPPTGRADLFVSSVDGKVYIQNSAGVTTLVGPSSGGAGATVLFSRLSAAVTNSTVTYAATGLTVTVTAAKVYRILAAGHFRSAAITTGIGLRLNGTATATRIRYNAAAIGGAAANQQYNSEIALATSPGVSAGVTVANKDYPWNVDGLIVVNAGGTITVEFASEVAASLVTIQPDSWLELAEVT